MFASCSAAAPWSAGRHVRFSGIPSESGVSFYLGAGGAYPCIQAAATRRRECIQSTCVAMPSATSRARFTSLVFIMASSCASRMSGSSPSSMARVSLMNGA